MEAPFPLSLLPFKFTKVSIGVTCVVVLVFVFFLATVLVTDEAEVVAEVDDAEVDAAEVAEVDDAEVGSGVDSGVAGMASDN